MTSQNKRRAGARLNLVACSLVNGKTMPRRLLERHHLILSLKVCQGDSYKIADTVRGEENVQA